MIKLVGVRVPTSRGKRRLRRFGRILAKYREQNVNKNPKVLTIRTQYMPYQFDDSYEHEESENLEILDGYYYSFPVATLKDSPLCHINFDIPFAQVKSERELLHKHFSFLYKNSKPLFPLG